MTVGVSLGGLLVYIGRLSETLTASGFSLFSNLCIWVENFTTNRAGFDQKRDVNFSGHGDQVEF